MRYHGAEIRVEVEDLGYDEPSLNKTYHVYVDGEWVEAFWSLEDAKHYVDTGEVLA